MSDFVDPYLDDETGILRNLLGAKTGDELKDLEAQIVFANELELEEVGVRRTSDLVELLAIHRQLFGNVYDWAGTIRTVDIKKDTKNAEFFLPVSKILSASEYVFGELNREHCLQGLAPEDFVERLAYFYDQLNYIHPFREGNGRVQRIFWSRVAYDARYEIVWGKVIGDENDEASRLAAETMDLSALSAMFKKIVEPLEK